jgi:hypothetical protein
MVVDGVSHRDTLRVEHALFRHHGDFDFHAAQIRGGGSKFNIENGKIWRTCVRANDTGAKKRVIPSAVEGSRGITGDFQNFISLSFTGFAFVVLEIDGKAYFVSRLRQASARDDLHGWLSLLNPGNSKRWYQMDAGAAGLRMAARAPPPPFLMEYLAE